MDFEKLGRELEGELHIDETTRRLYATDASAYRELPAAVAIPEEEEDIVKLVEFARKHTIGLIPRTAGTSLAGQVVGSGIVVDVSRHFNGILEINEKEAYAWVQPGIVRDDLNYHLKSYGYFFAPETSTSNRAMIGGMIGNNSCGANSVVYGSTREHLLEVKTVLADGTRAWFGPVDNNGFIARCNGNNTTGDLHTHLYLQIKDMLFDPENKKQILQGYPKEDIPRRNTGYALDMLLRQQPFDNGARPFNFCELIAGSEGTLAFVTAAKIKLTQLPPEHKALICIHSETIDESLRANLTALRFRPSACELMDHYILEATRRNIMYEQNRFFVEGDPSAILVVELTRESEKEVDEDAELLIEALKSERLGYSFPVVKGEDIKKVWGLRKAGLGLLSNIPGDSKPAPVIEDTAVDTKDLPAYIEEFNQILKKHELYAVHYAHAGSGELHLRPILNLKTEKGVRLFRTIAEEIATLVKKYKGSLSGEHGDGRLRGEFIPQMLGDHNYQLCKDIKATWDPEGIFNPGKIVDTAPMDTSLRFERNQQTPEFDTVLDFSESKGIVRAAEQCNGSGDCRKSELTGGVMCPSYMATRDERDTTRARANILREMLTKTQPSDNPFARSEIKEVMDLCLSCKGCKSECPSNVDVGKLKAEWQHQYYQEKGVPLRTRLIANFTRGMKLASNMRWAYNLVFGNKYTGNLAKTVMGFSTARSMPGISSVTLRKWFEKEFEPGASGQEVYLFCDEFTDYNESEIGQKTVKLLDRLGYQVRMVDHEESGRTYLSKGLLLEARQLAQKNVSTFYPKVSDAKPLLGIEPSAILTFRDEYISLLRDEEQQKARKLSENTFTVEEFLTAELRKGKIKTSQFTSEKRLIKFHGHCHQKSISSLTPTKQLLSLPENYEVHIIPSGCCGMAGSFGYEKEHYEVSMKIGELVLFPQIREQPEDVMIAAPGTSCRHQIKDGTNRKALHPLEILHDSLV